MWWLNWCWIKIIVTAACFANGPIRNLGLVGPVTSLFDAEFFCALGHYKWPPSVPQWTMDCVSSIQTLSTGDPRCLQYRDINYYSVPKSWCVNYSIIWWQHPHLDVGDSFSFCTCSTNIHWEPYARHASYGWSIWESRIMCVSCLNVSPQMGLITNLHSSIHREDKWSGQY